MNSHLIVVGKLKDDHISALEENYLKRIKLPFKIHEVKAFGDSMMKEETEIKDRISSLSKNQSLKRILLTEKGKSFNSKEFANLIENSQMENKDLIFVIGGALGFREEFKAESDFTLSLSEMTFPHRIARLLFVEQFYRAQTIIQGHPYNH